MRHAPTQSDRHHRQECFVRQRDAASCRQQGAPGHGDVPSTREVAAQATVAVDNGIDVLRKVEQAPATSVHELAKLRQDGVELRSRQAQRSLIKTIEGLRVGPELSLTKVTPAATAGVRARCGPRSTSGRGVPGPSPGWPSVLSKGISFSDSFRSPKAATFTTRAAHPAVAAACFGSAVK